MPPSSPAASLTVRAALGVAWAVCACAEPPSVEPAAPDEVDAPSAPSGAFVPLPEPADLDLDPARVALGEALFSDARLSADGTISCASCHPLDRGGADGLVVSLGVGGAAGGVNAPTVLNSGLNFAQYWDGRAATLEEQVDGPLLSPAEMGFTWEAAVEVISGDDDLRVAFEDAYPDGVQPANVRDAIATFERSLLTPSPYDRHLRGGAPLGEEAAAGMALFASLGCVACHQGANLGGNMFQKLGVMRDYFADRGDLTEADHGRFNVTKREEDRHLFKVPTLRNVALTAPYFHDGSAATLADAIRVMGRYQLARELEDDEVASLTAFLESLTGTLEARP